MQDKEQEKKEEKIDKVEDPEIVEEPEIVKDPEIVEEPEKLQKKEEEEKKQEMIEIPKDKFEEKLRNSFQAQKNSDRINPLVEDEEILQKAKEINMENYYKVIEGFTNDQWKEKKDEINKIREQRKDRKQKQTGLNVEEGTLSTIFEGTSTESNKKTESPSLNILLLEKDFKLPDFIDPNKETVNKNNQVIESRIPDVLPAIFNFLELVDNSNAISTIGTIEFTDKLAKLNTVATICNDEDETPTMFKELKEKITFEPLYKSPNTNTGGKTMKRNKGGKRKTMKLSKA